MNEWIFRLILLVVTMLSPEIRKSLETLLNQLEADAKKTANPWDDILIAMLRSLLLNS